jgi:hypothetical protein
MILRRPWARSSAAHRPRSGVPLALLLPLALAAATPAHASPVTLPVVPVRCEMVGGYGRLSFLWTDVVEYRMTREGPDIVVAFQQPARIEAGALAHERSACARWIGWRPVDGGVIVTLRLPDGNEARDARLGNRIVIDVFPTPEPLRPPPAASAPASSAPGPEVCGDGSAGLAARRRGGSGPDDDAPLFLAEPGRRGRRRARLDDVDRLRPAVAAGHPTAPPARRRGTNCGDPPAPASARHRPRADDDGTRLPPPGKGRPRLDRPSGIDAAAGDRRGDRVAADRGRWPRHASRSAGRRAGGAGRLHRSCRRQSRLRPPRRGRPRHLARLRLPRGAALDLAAGDRHRAAGGRPERAQPAGRRRVVAPERSRRLAGERSRARAGAAAGGRPRRTDRAGARLAGGIDRRRPRPAGGRPSGRRRRSHRPRRCAGAARPLLSRRRPRRRSPRRDRDPACAPPRTGRRPREPPDRRHRPLRPRSAGGGGGGFRHRRRRHRRGQDVGDARPPCRRRPRARPAVAAGVDDPDRNLPAAARAHRRACPARRRRRRRRGDDGADPARGAAGAGADDGGDRRPRLPGRPPSPPPPARSTQRSLPGIASPPPSSRGRRRKRRWRARRCCGDRDG